MNVKKKLTVYCSSYLPTSKQNWKHIAAYFEALYFAEYGNIRILFESGTDNTSTLGVLFHQDFESEIHDTHTRYLHIAEGLKTRLEKQSEEIFIAYSSYRPRNIIENTKIKDPMDSVIGDFIHSMYQLTKMFNSFYFINLDLIFREKGYESVFDIRNWYYAKFRLSLEGLKLIDNAVSNIIQITRNASKKILILDCDNTLWGGVLSEDGLDKINIGNDGKGNAFVGFQKEILRQYKKGILLAICSKNNQRDILEVFKKHSSMVLKDNHIISFKANWKEKYTNIEEISEELSIGLESFVFWDDDPLERQKIKNFLPQVEVIEPPVETEKWAKLLFELLSLSKIKITTEDKTKHQQYRARSNFMERSKAQKDKNSFLKGIQIKPQLFDLRHDHISRASQMTQKTNQFNFRNFSYTENEISIFLSNERHFVKMCSVSDIFGDHGNVGLLILKKKNSELYFLDSFILSCRILGRELESWMMQSILEEINSLGVGLLEIEYVQTVKNTPARIFLENFDQFIQSKSYTTDKCERIQYMIPTSHIHMDLNNIY